MVMGPQSRALLSIHGVHCVRGQTWESSAGSGQEMKVGWQCFGPSSVRLELELKSKTVLHTSLEKLSYITGECCRGRPEELMDKGIFIGARSRLKREFILCFNLHVTKGFRCTAGLPGRLTDVQVNLPLFFAPGLSLSDGFVGGAALGPEGTSQESAVAAEQIGEQTVTLGHSHAPLSGEPESSGGGRWTITHMLCWLDDTMWKNEEEKGRFKRKSFIRRQSRRGFKGFTRDKVIFKDDSPRLCVEAADISPAFQHYSPFYFMCIRKQ